MERTLSANPADVVLRTPTEADHPRFARLIREWWDEHPPRPERLWFRHFAATSVVAETADGRPAAVAIGFGSAGDPLRGVLLLVAVAPELRRRGVGRSVVAAVEARLAAARVAMAEAAVWPGNRAGVRFLEAMGYQPSEASQGSRLYGVPAIADYDGEGEDRSVMERRLSDA